ncbi:hypothetical protein FNV43_RR24549 [Rhamnella rubrinervis]|uniref:Heparanase-like protein 2 n=1 Tax=Rhamnella rubrinervis TaxID=2594499 RepID=A0A8K0DYA8_9ROSA|nr:hypothetical protein FNV43_RR24549 [Rhamnella rubrinervis]
MDWPKFHNTTSFLSGFPTKKRGSEEKRPYDKFVADHRFDQAQHASWKTIAISSKVNSDRSFDELCGGLSSFSPLRIRVGGSLQDQVVYNIGYANPECPQFTKTTDSLFGFSKGCLPLKRRDELNDLFNQTGVKMTFGLNALYGNKRSQENKVLWIGDWNLQNARDLMKYTIPKGYKIDSYKLGNELCGIGFAARLESEQYGKDFIELKKLATELYLEACTRPKVLGPGGFYDKKWFNTFLQVTGPDVVDAVTDYLYSLGAVHFCGNQLMGKKVLSTRHNGSPYLRAYYHCSMNHPGVCLLLINMSNSTYSDISIVNDFNLYLEQHQDSNSNARPQREEYHLTPKDGDIQRIDSV